MRCLILFSDAERCAKRPIVLANARNRSSLTEVNAVMRSMVLGTEMSALVRQFTKRTTPMRDGLIELPLLAAEFAKLKQLWVLCRKLSTSRVLKKAR